MLIHGDKVRWLFWLRWKMFLRTYTRKATLNIIGGILSLLFVFLFAGGLAIGSFFGYRDLPAPANTELLFIVLGALYLFWILLPLLEITTNEGFDLSKLVLFPITRGEMMVSLLFSTLLDIPTLGLFFMFLAVIAAWSSSVPLALVSLLSMLIFYVQMVGISQLVLALLQPVLQSRRFRDMYILLTVLLASGAYLCQFAVRGILSRNFVDLLNQGAFSPYLQWLPSGMAARAIQQASVGNWGMSFVWLGALALVSAVVVFLWQLLVERGLTAAETGGSVGGVRRRTEHVSPGRIAPTGTNGTQTIHTGLIERLIPIRMRTLMVKDVRYFWRDPQLKALLLQSLISLAFLGFVMFVNFGNHSRINMLGPWAVMFGPAIILVSLFTLSYNVLGLERQSLTTLFLFPVPPWQILLAKNLLVMLLGLVEILLIALAGAILTKAWAFILPGIVVGLAGMAIIIGIGNFTSVFMPQQMRFRTRGFNTMSNMSTGAGCLRGLLSALSLYGTLFVMIPVGLALGIPYATGSLWIWSITIPVSLLYGAAIYAGITFLAAPRILNKAPEILNAIVKE